MSPTVWLSEDSTPVRPLRDNNVLSTATRIGVRHARLDKGTVWITVLHTPIYLTVNARAIGHIHHIRGCIHRSPKGGVRNDTLDTRLVQQRQRVMTAQVLGAVRDGGQDRGESGVCVC